MKKNCRWLTGEYGKGKTSKSKRAPVKANKASAKRGSSSENDALIAEQALQVRGVGSWIIDSGATCHMCADEKLFTELSPLGEQMSVTLGDGHKLEAVGQGTVKLIMNLEDGKRECRLLNVLHAPSMAYNSLSVSTVVENGKDTVFKEGICEIITKNGVVVARAKRCGSLYYLDCKKSENVNVASAKELNILWHRRLGHHGLGNKLSG